jgi:hypothetical protein
LKFENFTQEISKFQNSKNCMDQVGRKANFPENFSFLALKTDEVVSRQIHQQRRRRTVGRVEQFCARITKIQNLQITKF